ncbi:PqqD family protein [Streptomyces genisteinicus]|uniref:PqqD family protein n=1 Tax=Streptomyces genisteinicus TaxID=2768068 RepID=A0A7H0I503_9ACTN|nr:PqqD family protein [Streptomyces genisteinicus]QNP67869.1 PqqD family protein [Streptomyces genisteinicus]
MPGVGVDIGADGSLELRRPDTAGLLPRTYHGSPVCTAMWIALRRHDGDPDAAARTLARHWGADLVGTRAELDQWVSELCDAGLARLTP